jgi:hypothetical protein
MTTPKKGTEYELVVAEVARAMDPNATVEQGTWVDGPDGRRDQDVVVRGEVEGKQRTVLIERKDFGPKRTVGIDLVDALDSKRKDLGVDTSFLCCNVGFTGPAIRKAARVGIGLIGVMKKGDKRIRVSIVHAVYTRQIKVEHLKIGLRHEGEEHKLSKVPPETLMFEGLPLANWVGQRAALVIAANPVVNGDITDSYQLKEAVTVESPDGPLTVDEFYYHLRITGGWFEQEVTYDASAGLYDWLRHRVRLAPGQSQLHIEGLNFAGGTPVERPPKHALLRGDIREGEIALGFAQVTGLRMSNEDIPDMSRHVPPDDLDPLMKALPDVGIRSTPPADKNDHWLDSPPA